MGILRSGERWICARVAGDVLDIGSDGEAMSLLRREGHRVVEVDAEQGGKLSFEDGSFDTVVLGDPLVALVSRERPIAEARRVLCPGGRLIVAVPYEGDRDEDAGLSLQALLGELSSFSVKEIETLDERLFVLAERSREKSRAEVWRRALGVAERRLAEREEEIAALTAAVAGLEARRDNEERALVDARDNVERLEAALAAAAHQRDLKEEAARLATDGVAHLEQRLEGLRHEGERERAEAQRRLTEAERESERRQAEAASAEEARRELAALRGKLRERERALAAAETLVEAQGTDLAEARRSLDDRQLELAEARSRLEAREEHLQNAQAGVESRDRKLAAADRVLESREAELQRLQAAVREGERRLALTEARLVKSQQRAERFRGSLVSIREGRSYRAMRVLWRLRRPFRRAPRDPVEAGGGPDDDPGPPATIEPASVPIPETVAPPAPAVAVSPPPPRQPGDRLRVAAIFDEMSAACFAPECDLIPLTFDGWREQLDRHRPDLLLVESAWSANDGEWQYRIAKYPRKDLVGLPALRALLDGCRERGVPTAFWNKEDPVHFDRFARSGGPLRPRLHHRCRLRRALPGPARQGHRHARSPSPRSRASTTRPRSSGSAAPRRVSPVPVPRPPSRPPPFAGGTAGRRPPATGSSSTTAVSPPTTAHSAFPERFQPHVLGASLTSDVLDVYKSHRVFLNANSVAGSATMCSRRVFELAACDTPILSTPGAALTELFGEGLIAEAGDEATAAQCLEGLLGDADDRARRARAARRVVFAKHTYAQRLKTIAATAGLDTSSLDRPPFALPHESSNGAASPAEAQENGGDRHPWLLVTQPGIALSDEALADLRAAASFAEADVIGAYPARNGDRPVEHRQVPEADPRALLLRRELVEARGRPSGAPEDVLACLRQWGDDGIRIYATDADLISTPKP